MTEDILTAELAQGGMTFRRQAEIYIANNGWGDKTGVSLTQGLLAEVERLRQAVIDLTAKLALGGVAHDDPTLVQQVGELARLERVRAQGAERAVIDLTAQVDLLTRGKAHAVTADGGKLITCLEYDLAAAERARDEARRAVGRLKELATAEALRRHESTAPVARLNAWESGGRHGYVFQTCEHPNCVAVRTPQFLQPGESNTENPQGPTLVKTEPKYRDRLLEAAYVLAASSDAESPAVFLAVVDAILEDISERDDTILHSLESNAKTWEMNSVRLGTYADGLREAAGLMKQIHGGTNAENSRQPM